MKATKHIKLLAVAGLMTIAYSCEKFEALERTEDCVETHENSAGDQPVMKSMQGGNGSSSNDKDSDVITDPGNDGDYDKEDPNAGTGASSNN